MLPAHRTTAWTPVLDGALADQARIALANTVDAIAREPIDRGRPDRLVVFWSYALTVFSDARFEEAYALAVERLLADLRPDANPGLYGGLAGAGWALAHVSEDDADDDDGDEVLRWIDEVLLDTLSPGPWHGPYDLIEGLTGIGIYFLERTANGGGGVSARRGLDRVIHHLDALAAPTPTGVSFHTRPELLPEWQRPHCPEGQYNCGVAHGVPGVIAFLARVAARDGESSRAASLCHEAMRWLRAQDLGPDPRGRFPAWVAPTRASARTRAAWCYGDPGIAVALWAAALRIGAPADDWHRLALECAARPSTLSDVADPHLCHGAIGLAHLFNRCYQASGDTRFRDASRTWFAHGLAMPPTAAPLSATSDDILEGEAGVGLALLAAIRDDEPGWDRLLAADLPPGASRAR